MPNRPYTSKQMGDACEMLVAAEMTHAGVLALKVPDCWPHYDVIAQPQGGGIPQRVQLSHEPLSEMGIHSSFTTSMISLTGWRACCFQAAARRPAEFS